MLELGTGIQPEDFRAETTSLPHIDIIRKLDSSSELFTVLVLKTKMTMPYTTVFIELDCAYRYTESENQFRQTEQK